jgi:hypothetical protein
MTKSWQRLLSCSRHGQAGQALILVLVFVLLGSLTIVPTLSYMSTTLKANFTYENKSRELYTADAGIENGLWRIKYDLLGPTYDIYDYTSIWNYQTDPVNGRQAAVKIKNIWLPTNVTLASLGMNSADAKSLVDAQKLVVTGSYGTMDYEPYHIKLEFSPAAADNLTIKSVGIWLPQGFTYTANSSELETHGPFSGFYPDSVSISSVSGGQTVIWHYDGDTTYPELANFHDCVTQNGTMTASFHFSYTGPADNPTAKPIAVAWATCEMHDSTGLPVFNPYAIQNVPIAWDTDARFYKITSATGNTQIESYSSKSSLRNLGNAIAGDYVALGNSLMTGGSNPDYIKSTLLTTSTANVDAVAPLYPADADVLTAYLYWSGFQYDVSQWADNGNDFNNWDKTIQIRMPVSDNETSGTWNTAPCWDEVAKTEIDDNTFMTGNVTSSGTFYKLFSFSAFNVPLGNTISDITVYFRAKKLTTSTANIQGYIKAGGSYSNAGSVNPATGWTTYSATFATNPKTGAAWTVADIDGSGSNPLQEFGVYSTDLNPAVEVSMVYAQVNYGQWTINSGQFQGTGSSNTTTDIRTITLKNSLDLSSYPAGTVSIGWKQTKSNNLEDADTLYYAVSGNGGTTWSSNMEAFHGNNSPDSPDYYVIPAAYKTSTFKIRFYFNFNATDEYVYLDEINLYYMPPDTTATFAIEGQPVCFDINGDATAGTDPIDASFSAVLVAPNVGTTTPGYFYACYRDVSKLVKTFPIVAGETHHTGKHNYTVGGVSGNLNQYVSFAGWSMIIIYGSPKTAGHYLYLRDIHDIYAACPQNGDLDFDHDGQPGGVISGFTFPNPILDKDGAITDNVSATLTCFVCEGDTYTGDYLKITGEQVGAATVNLSNSASPSNNVWNSASPGMTYNGIDVDTFQVLWSDHVFKQGDHKVTLHMPTLQDVWNLVYIIMSVRSETVTGGTSSYIIQSNQ